MKANNANTLDSKSGIIFPELSYKIVGAAFDVFNKSGWGLPEKYYQNALAKKLTALDVGFKREAYIPLSYEEENFGRYFADFLVENKILLELKVVPKLGYTHRQTNTGIP